MEDKKKKPFQKKHLHFRKEHCYDDVMNILQYMFASTFECDVYGTSVPCSLLLCPSPFSRALIWTAILRPFKEGGSKQEEGGKGKGKGS